MQDRVLRWWQTRNTICSDRGRGDRVITHSCRPCPTARPSSRSRPVLTGGDRGRAHQAGPRAKDALAALNPKLPEPRRAALRRLRDPATASVLDDALVLWFPGPNTETGEDMAELHLHGRPCGCRGGARRAVAAAGLPTARAGRVHAALVRERQARSHRGRGPCRPGVGRDRGAARARRCASLSGALGGRAETWRQRLIGALGAGGGGASTSPTRRMCRTT